MNNYWKGKKVLITGISGFVGSRIAEKLISLGAEVVGVVKDLNIDAGVAMSTLGAVIEHGDICDYQFLRRVISEHEIEVVFHFAAYSIVRVSARDPLTTYNVNIMGTVNLLEAIRNVGSTVKSIVVASSDKAYGDHETLPYTESLPLQPKNTYDTSKACMDLIARSYAHNYGMPIVVTRCSNIYGPGDRNFSRIIPNTIRRILEGKQPMLYSDVENMEREFIFIDDVITAYVKLAQVAEKYAGEAFNIGETEPIKIRKLVELVCKVMGREDLEPEIVPREVTFKEIQKQFIDASKIEEAIKWLPTTGLAVGIDQTANWIRSISK
jgi:CDP-glucose 4,6-dehydratase